MDERVVLHLLELNRRFYSQFGAAFAATRRRIQDGVRRVLAGLPDEGNWLDIGCGSGALGLAWLTARRQSHYLGLDSSRELLDAAEQSVQDWRSRQASPIQPRVQYALADLGDPKWVHKVHGAPFRGVLAFALLHHIPGAAQRLDLLRQVHRLIEPGGCFVHSEWQYQHSAKLMQRRQPWERVGLSESQVEPGDTLLDWRYALPGQAEQVGLRYVHLFETDELAGLANAAGFTIVETFESDGKGGRLGLYQVWQRQ